MPYNLTIVCLANSRKPGGRCVAGKELEKGKVGKWIRPIGVRAHAISDAECQCSDGNGLHHLDVVTIPCQKHIPTLHQTENHQIAAGTVWARVGTVAYGKISAFLDNPKSLWMNTSESSGGVNDRVTLDEVAMCSDSLYFIIPEKLSIIVLRKFGETKVRALFEYKKTQYNLKVSDVAIEAEYGQKGVGRYPIEPMPMCVSLAEELRHDNGERYHYKVVASILVPGNHA